MTGILLPVTTMIEFIGALIISAAAAQTLLMLLRGDSLRAARRCIAAGAIAGLDFKVAATLLKTLTLLRWDQIGMFTCILFLRTLLKLAFSMEQRQ